MIKIFVFFSFLAQKIFAENPLDSIENLHDTIIHDLFAKKVLKNILFYFAKNSTLMGSVDKDGIT